MEPATLRRAERGLFRAAAGAKLKLGWEERKALRGGGVAGERGGLGGGARERFQERVYFAGETGEQSPLPKVAGSSGSSITTDHLHSADVSCSFILIHSFNMLVDTHDGR